MDKIGATLDDVAIIYEDSLDAEAWEKFISSLKENEAEPDKPVLEKLEVAKLLRWKEGRHYCQKGIAGWP